MFDKFVGPSDAFDGGGDAVDVKEFNDAGTESVGEDMVFVGADYFCFFGFG